jgi:hypothetical protein
MTVQLSQHKAIPKVHSDAAVTTKSERTLWSKWHKHTRWLGQNERKRGRARWSWRGELAATSCTYTSRHPSTYKGCPLIPIPIELVTEGSKHAGKNPRRNRHRVPNDHIQGTQIGAYHRNSTGSTKYEGKVHARCYGHGEANSRSQRASTTFPNRLEGTVYTR